MFLDILEFRVEYKQTKKLEKTVFNVWSQICGKIAYVSKNYF